MMGALIIRWRGKQFGLSGFDYRLRRLPEDQVAYAAIHPGKKIPPPAWCPIGKVVTFKYRELTDRGVPKEARFWRIRDAE